MDAKPSPSTPASAPMPECCAECGVARPGLVKLSGLLICPECKPRALDKLREGVLLGPTGGFAGPWREGKHLVVSKQGPMTERCIKCGEPPVKHLRTQLTWHRPALYILVVISLPIYFIVALMVRKKATFHIPVCGRCNSRRVRNIVIGFASFFLGLGFICTAFWMAGSHDELTDAACIAGLVLIIFSLFWAAWGQFLLAKKITDRFVWIEKVSQDMLAKLQPWPGE